jgi:PAS domain S-box-containing protein
MLEAGEETVALHEQVERLKQRVAQLERNDAIHQKTIEASPDVTFRFDPDALCTYVSPAIADVLGYTPEEYVGSSGFAIIHPDEQDLAQLLRERLLPAMPGTGSDRLGPVLSRIRHKGGHFVWVETMVVTIRDPDTGMVQELVLTARDINARV